MNHVRAYRNLLRELKSSTPGKLNRTLAAEFRTMFDKFRGADVAERSRLEYDSRNAVVFLKAQREYKELLERYNPLVDLTAEERIEATARRVGLNMPVNES